MKTAKAVLGNWHVGVAAEAAAAALFARCGYDVSVQYGANQPGYDLIVAQGSRILKVSVKGSQTGRENTRPNGGHHSSGGGRPQPGCGIVFPHPVSGSPLFCSF